MNTIVQQTLKPATETLPRDGARWASSRSTSRPAGATATGISEILAMRVGCWQAPVNIGISRGQAVRGGRGFSPRGDR